MANTNIPGVYTSIIDRTFTQPITIGGRSVLIAGFSKYGNAGDNDFYTFSDITDMEYNLGKIDLKKYGKGLFYATGALSRTQNVIFKRLVPSDAKYSNIFFKVNGEVESKVDVIDPEASIVNTLLNDSGSTSDNFNIQKYIFDGNLEGESTLTCDYNPDYVKVYKNGLLLSGSNFDNDTSNHYLTDSSGKNITLFHNYDTDLGDYTGLLNGDIIQVFTLLNNVGAANPATFYRESHKIIGSITNLPLNNSIPTGFTNFEIYKNGLKLNIDEFNYPSVDDDSINVVVPTVDGDIIEIYAYVDADSTQTLGGNSNALSDGNTVLSGGTIQYKASASVSQVSVLLPGAGLNVIPDHIEITKEGILLDSSDYHIIDFENPTDTSTEFNIKFTSNLSIGDVVIISFAKELDEDHYYGTLYAAAPGEGYNNIYVQFNPAYDLEKFYADDNGESRYRFNFLRASIIEETSNGNRIIGDSIPLSLIDVDPETNTPIVDNVVGDELFINTKFEDSNIFAKFALNPNVIEDLYKDLNIADLTKDNTGVLNSHRFILQDIITGTNYELFINDENIQELRASAVPGKPAIFMKQINWTPGDNYTKISIANGELMFEEEANVTTYYENIYVDGDLSFYSATLKKIDVDNYEFIMATHKTKRQLLFDNLIGTNTNSSWQLKNGTNGENLIKNSRLNMSVAGTNDSENAKQLMVDFYKNNAMIREVAYPLLDFDYIPDWTDDIDVQTAIVNLADNIGVSMPIVSLPLAKSKDEDYKTRVEKFYASSYNTAIYSGQVNVNHYSESTGQRIACSNSYYALLNHLQIDNSISITEPMANRNKGALPVAGAKLTYTVTTQDVEKLRRNQINTIIKESSGVYFIDQLTGYKKASKLSRINVVKVIHRIRKDLPVILKDLIQVKATATIVEEARTRTLQYLNRWAITARNGNDEIFESISVDANYIENEYKLIVAVTLKPIGTIERIEVPITIV